MKSGVMIQEQDKVMTARDHGKKARSLELIKKLDPWLDQETGQALFLDLGADNTCVFSL